MPPRRASANILRKLRGQNLRLKIMGKILKLPGMVDTSSWVCFQWQSRCWLEFRSFNHIFQEKLFWSAIIFHHHHLPSIWQKHLLAKDLRNLQMGETLNVHVDRFAPPALVNLVAHIDTTFTAGSWSNWMASAISGKGGTWPTWLLEKGGNTLWNTWGRDPWTTRYPIVHNYFPRYSRSKSQCWLSDLNVKVLGFLHRAGFWEGPCQKNKGITREVRRLWSPGPRIVTSCRPRKRQVFSGIGSPLTAQRLHSFPATCGCPAMSSPEPEDWGKLGTDTTRCNPRSKKGVVLLSYIFWDMFQKWHHLSSKNPRATACERGQFKMNATLVTRKGLASSGGSISSWILSRGRFS